MASGISNYLYLILTNNSISGSIPALWGDAKHGWKDGLSALYLDQNHLTGPLPQLWSDSNSLPNLTIMYAHDNMLTGPVGWDAANLPMLRNLVLLPGELSEIASAHSCALLCLWWSETISKAHTCESVHLCASSLQQTAHLWLHKSGLLLIDRLKRPRILMYVPS